MSRLSFGSVHTSVRWSGLLGVLGLLAGCGDNSTDSNYAEQTYATYESAAAGQIHFAVKTQQSGALTELADRSLQQILPVPDTWIVTRQLGPELKEVQRVPRDKMQDEWSEPLPLSKFTEMGKSITDATYRLLSVDTTLAGATANHSALEVCWSGSSCLVIDPVVLQLDGFVADRTTLRTAGWAMTSGQLKEAALTAGRTCSLVSHPSWGGEYIDWPAWTQKYRNVYGVVMVTKNLGRQHVEVDCYVDEGSCKAAPHGFSNASSCFANVPFSCSCKNSGFQQGVTGSAAKAACETECAHRLAFSASVSFEKNGTGASFDIKWDSQGSVDSNGGDLYDTCAWH